MSSEETTSLVKKFVPGYRVEVHETSGQYESIEEDANSATVSENQYDKVPTWLLWTKKPTVLGISVVYIFMGLGGMSVSARELLLFDKACEQNMKDGVCSNVANQLLIADYQSVGSILKQTSSIIGLSVTGVVSDRFGRKPVLFLTCINFLFNSLLFLALIRYVEGFKFKTLVMLQVILGFFSEGTMLGTCSAYIADITSPATRSSKVSFSLATLSASMLIGQFCGTALLGYGKSIGLSPTQNNYNAMYFEIFSMILMVLYGAFLPESLHKTEDRSTYNYRFGWRDITGHTYEVVEQVKLLRLPSDLIPVTLKHRSKELRLQVCVLVLINCLFMLKNSLASLLFQYGIYRYGWDSQTISFFMMTSAFIGLSVLGVIIPFVNEYVLKRGLRLSFKDGQLDSIDKFNIYLGLFSEFAVCTLSGLSTNTTELIASYAICCYTSALVPTVFSTITKFFPPNKTNQVLSTMHIVSALFNTVAPSVFMQIYKFGLLHSIIGLPFFVLGVTCVIPFGLLISSKLIRT
ncbi:MFS general substrate transporter [Yamadazyma tenuis ATCC 10573]|uniref:MFS general substrate transporter n=1 Tax=Candida tenuis (strain ATCC 10573 / BCRC 21748 / CBS 615 / JCM 9827 / NBRC 10315 / NRRL Y-1498 / VKM Y-70) TaxID=590646 RepID=G3B8U4_CANTC|nr:MFS general substrate transporter [Yamadazyma tenuis ATCC 10573]EGV62964.1 MFS general substrate transporter [Yamadazyma tenuis ATCC 10573]